MTNLALNNHAPAQEHQYRKSVSSTYPDVFTEIYQEDINLVVWQHTLSNSLLASAKALIEQQPNLKAVMTVKPDETYHHLIDHLTSLRDAHELCEHISVLVDMFCTIFDLKRVGLRLTALDRPMCPKFHVDKVPCRLVTTLVGETTQWLNNNVADRTKLGAGSLGISDDESGLFQSHKDINQLMTGDVALLKGEGWFDNSGGGLIHRSPALKSGERRLLLTLDFID